MNPARRIGPWLLGALVALCAPALARAAEPYRVTASIKPAQGITDARPFQLVILVEGAGSPQVSAPTLPRMANLRVIGGPNTNSSFVWRNGQSSANYQLLYTLLAENAGAAEIPALQVKVDSKVYRTQPIRFTVQAGEQGPPSAPTPAPGRSRNRRPADEVQVFLRAELGSDEVWVGETVSLNVTLFTAQRISSPRWIKQPDFANFWVESPELDPDQEAFRKRINGVDYTAYPIDRRLLIPPGPGEFEIGPYVAQMQARLSRGDPFDIFSLGRSENIVRKTEPLTLRVRQLPAGAPEDFSGVVGDYSLRASLDRDEASVDDAVALKVTVQGEGSLRAARAPVFDRPADLKVFDPEVKESFKIKDGKMISTKSWEWIVVPLAPGETRLPEIRFPFYNPAAERYEVARADSLILAVERGERRSDAPLARGDIQLQRRDLAFIKPLRDSLNEGSPRAHRRQLFLVLLFLPLGLVPLAIVLGRQQARLQRDLGRSRARRAHAVAKKRFRAARKHLNQPDAAGFHEEVARTLVEYVADRFNRSGAGLTYDLADELLASAHVDPDLRRKFRSCLETCDFARFVPASAQAERRVEVIDEAVGVVEQLERSR